MFAKTPLFESLPHLYKDRSGAIRLAMVADVKGLRFLFPNPCSKAILYTSISLQVTSRKRL
ncbi:hypothetical protein skT53_29080 [Effusibacillus dendaii]|uniref:Uncharacterized protein n=1 Tax=Effusibacillus dendaii TaxID=2743772 RepID=A0A7I8DCK3_9BACL|nr:hypothetical protein skT53_29080 [Effusibacillus dendaii]